jgi:hypothetical protein
VSRAVTMILDRTLGLRPVSRSRRAELLACPTANSESDSESDAGRPGGSDRRTLTVTRTRCGRDSDWPRLTVTITDDVGAAQAGT